MFKLPKLNYSKTALEPFLSGEAMEYHYGKHHKAYVDEVNRFIQWSKYENSTLEEIVAMSDGVLFNNASQAWNHSFYWFCLCPAEKAKPVSETFSGKINETFGSMSEFKRVFGEHVMQIFGSGWVWLAADVTGRLSIVSLSNADSPFRHGLIPLLACDVWEHAYYVDYRNNRRKYLDGFLDMIDWSFVEKNLKLEQIPNMTQYMLVGEHPRKEKESPGRHAPL
jgi:superoxide dismutase, Fe-Mn family